MTHWVPSESEQAALLRRALLRRVPRCDGGAGGKGATAIGRHRKRGQRMAPRLEAAQHRAGGCIQAHHLPVCTGCIQRASVWRPCHGGHTPAAGQTLSKTSLHAFWHFWIGHTDGTRNQKWLLENSRE